MPVTGIPAFNAISVLKIEPVVFSSSDVRLTGQGAFVNTENGMTYGQTTCSRWSKRTLEKLAELRTAMEEDMAAMVFVQAGPTSPAGPVVDPGGIGETLRNNADAPQV